MRATANARQRSEEATQAPAPVAAAVEPPGEEELIMHLERDQFVAETSRPVPRAVLGRGAVAALWALRVFALVVSAMVVYTFIDLLR
jgi:hypothetical protein